MSLNFTKSMLITNHIYKPNLCWKVVQVAVYDQEGWCVTYLQVNIVAQWTKSLILASGRRGLAHSA